MKGKTRRETLQLIGAASALAIVTTAGCDDDDTDGTSGGEDSGVNGGEDAGAIGGEDAGATPEARIIRKSASAMTATEIAAFTAGFDLFATIGPNQDFNFQHFDFDLHQHHGAIIPPDSLTAEIHEGTPADRFLPWHRAFIIEFEKVCRALLRDAGNEAQADLFFVPYWDGAADQAMPPWMNTYVPNGTRAESVDGLPEGHVAADVAAGQVYDVRLERWVAQMEGFETLPPEEQMDALMAIEDFETFTRTTDYSLTILTDGDPDLAGQVETVIGRLPDGARFQPLADAIRRGRVARPGQVELLRALVMLKVATGRARRAAEPTAPDLASLLELVAPVLLNAPHGTYHLWSAGEDPDNLGAEPGAGLRGTVTYFNELVGDPMFWMLHCDLDRLWYAWQERHGQLPPLSGDDAVFRTWSEGATWSLDDLTDHENLPYGFDALRS